MLTIRLFGQLQIITENYALPALDSGKVRELLSYLLLHRHRMHSRELLADRLWRDSPHARKHLRQTLWQVQSALGDHAHHLLHIEGDWIGIPLATDAVWIDLDEFEAAAVTAQERCGNLLSAVCAERIMRAVELYRGDLLEDLNTEWCQIERQRVRSLLITLLDKLMVYHEHAGHYELAKAYGTWSLQVDHAHERTHQRLMRIHYHLGDRAGALRQYEQCVRALRDELGVEPAYATRLMVDQIASGMLVDSPSQTNSLPQLIELLQHTLVHVECEVEQFLAQRG